MPSHYRIHWTVRRQYWHDSCAPSAIRNMALGMTGHDYHRGPARWTHYLIHRNGRWIHNPNFGATTVIVRNAMNNHLDNYGHWAVTHVDGKWDLMGYVMMDTYDYGQPVVQDIRTGPLAIWNPKNYKHYDVLGGWQHHRGGGDFLWLAEEWYGAPYIQGWHRVWKAHDYQAIQHGVQEQWGKGGLVV